MVFELETRNSEKVCKSNPRDVARVAIQNTLSPTLWKENWKFSESLVKIIREHRIMSHPIMDAFERGKFDKEQIRFIHIEFYQAFADVFTDAVIQAMFKASCLENLKPTAKVTARFLLQFNLLEELGFKPNPEIDDSFFGNPKWAHFSQYYETLTALSFNQAALSNYIPLASALACRATFESAYDDYLLLMTVLATSEVVFHDYASLWAKAVSKATEIDVTKGYHSIHVEDETGDSIEDGHAHDAWLLVTQAVNADRYQEIEHKLEVCLNTWASFLDDLFKTDTKELI